MGRTLEFALATTMITIVESSFACFIATMVGRRITELFNKLNAVLLF